MIGRQLGHFRLVALLGAGGMGQVYRARDAHLDRDVAVKVLPPGLVADARALQRFRREALALSRSHHPHIAVVYDFAEQDGIAFLAMELIEGESLQTRLERGALDEADVRKLGAQVASALAAAHAQGVIHRDLKPANLMITSLGDAKVLDFGLARELPGISTTVETTQLTESHALVGTLPYMAPEQLAGAPVDARTDVFALGTVLYEMTTGVRPFAGDSMISLGHEILHGTPVPLRERRPAVSMALERVVHRCLEKEPANRFATAAEVEHALSDAATTVMSQRPVAGRTSSSGSQRRTLRGAPALVAAMLAVVAVALLAHRYRSSDTIRSLAVMPLENLSRNADEQYFAEGITDELIVTLQEVDALRVISRSSSRSLDRTSLTVPEIGRRLHVDALVTGSVQRASNRVRIRAQLVRVRTDQNLWAESFEGSPEDVLELQSRVARAIVDRVRARLDPEETSRLETPRKVNPAAYEHYLRGKLQFNQYTSDSWRRALASFEHAIELSPDFAPAHAGLADTYGAMSGSLIPSSVAMPRARAAAARAIELDPRLASAYASAGYVQMTFEHDWKGAEASYQRGLALSPHDLLCLQNYGYLLVATGSFAQARRMFLRARDVDPLSPLVSTMALWPLNYGGKTDSCIVEAMALKNADSTVWYPRFILGQALVFSGRLAEGIHELEWVRSNQPFSITTGWLGYAYGVAGRPEQARSVLRDLERSARREVVQPYALAIVHMGLGDVDRALSLLETGVEQHSDELVFLKVDPIWKPVRTRPRFRKLLAALHLDG